MPLKQIERIPFTLPMIEKQGRKDLNIYNQKLCAAIKAQMIKVVNGQSTDFDEAVCKIVEAIWQDGYSGGLSDMDKMHKKVDAMIEKAKNIK